MVPKSNQSSISLYLGLHYIYRCFIGNCWISETPPPSILSFGAKSPLTKAFVLIVPFLDQINTMILQFNVNFPHFSEQKSIAIFSFRKVRVEKA